MFFLRILVALSLVFTLPLLAHAKPKAIPHAVLIQQLSQEELACRAGGILVQFIAVDRDALVPLTTTLARLRVILATSSAQYKNGIVEIAQILYQSPTISEARARQLFEIGCMKNITIPVIR